MCQTLFRSHKVFQRKGATINGQSIGTGRYVRYCFAQIDHFYQIQLDIIIAAVISLDRYSGVISKDPAKKQLTVKAGTRVRDVVRALLDEGLAFAAQPSHDAQSIAGILSTDVHGTGKN
jgi:FAD/FMN-containing dehydrogenase